MHCPLCNHTAHNRPRDEYDTFVETYGIPRQSLYLIDRIITEERRKYASLASAIKIIIDKLGLEPVIPMSEHAHNTPQPPVSNGYTPMTILCNECHSMFRFHRTENAAHIPPCYCVFCGSTSITFNVDNDLDYIERIAAIYKMSPSMIRTLLDMFQHQNTHAKFSLFIEALRSEARAALNVPTPTGVN